MAIEVSIPTQLRSLTADKDTVEASGATIAEVIADLDTQFPGMKERLMKPDGGLNRFINIYVNGEDVRFLDDKDTAVKGNDEVSIVAAVAGG